MSRGNILYQDVDLDFILVVVACLPTFEHSSIIQRSELGDFEGYVISRQAFKIYLEVEFLVS